MGVRVEPRSSGRARPQGSGFELAVWYLMRLTGVALFVLALAHFSILHFIFDPAEQDAAFITNQRWNQLFWRAFDWLLLMTVLFHGFMGMRTVVIDFTALGAGDTAYPAARPGRVRRLLRYLSGPRARIVYLSSLYLLAGVLFVIGTSVILTLPMPGGGR